MTNITSLISPLKRRGSGIGASTACLFHENGAKVVIADIQDNKGEALARKLGESACYIHCDVTNEDDIRNLTDATISKCGKLDVMHNNAGILDRTLSTILDITKSEIDQVIGVNLVGALLGAKHAARVMAPQRKGYILFTASACTAIAGLLSGNAYAVSKYGVLGVTKNLAAELGLVTPMIAPNETEVRNIEQSLTATGNLKGEIMKPEGLAYTALYLASDGANYVSGLNLVLDGGFSIVNSTIMKAFNLIH
ncbi:hypothetical protein ES332_A09G169000v1 [Gossypium tomentosum]|uniref:Uncharacterized protein n=1 Tax=Gossypium tomentosum TaxID=34277 RepID=A0A5D2P3F0_GOSTO|nr:hypothetical protein ES332_A09G169000v1 [Gossypium tomentosum]